MYENTRNYIGRDQSGHYKQEIGDYVYIVRSSHTGVIPEITIECFDPANGNKKIGEAVFEVRGLPTKHLVSSWTWVEKAYEGKGVAGTMYAYVKSLGNDIMPSDDQTTKGKKMWSKWKANGDAKHLLPAKSG